MPEGKLIECSHCKGALKETFRTLDLKEYKCVSCGRIYTLHHNVIEWPEGTRAAQEGRNLRDGGFASGN